MTHLNKIESNERAGIIFHLLFEGQVNVDPILIILNFFGRILLLLLLRSPEIRE